MKTLNILLIDDDASDRKLIRQTLSESAGRIRFTVDTASELRESVELLKSRHYDVVLLDLNLPDSSGKKTVESVCKTSPDTPVIVLTGFDEQDLGLDVIRCGAEDYLPKGSGLTFTLFNAIRYAIERKHSKVYLHNAKKELEHINFQLMQATNTAKQMAQEARKADMLKSEFLANMSHEIRTPMNAIIGFSEILKDENLSSQQSAYVGYILENSRHLLDMVNDILDFSKAEVGKIELEMVEFNMGTLLAGVESMMGQLARNKKLDFEIVYDGSVPRVIKTDPQRLRQCLVNLIGNSIKFTESGFVRLKLATVVNDGCPFIRFDVVDSGIGIRQEKHESVFESFTQADSGTSRKYGGTGLGLAITKRLVELLGGQINLESEPGKGSVFSIIIPANIELSMLAGCDNFEDTKIIDTGGCYRDRSSEKFSGTVLIADDSRTSQILVKLILERAGIKVISACNGAEAVDLAGSNDIDLILMDIHMPGIGGYEAAEQICLCGCEAAVVAMTAEARPEERDSYYKCGYSDFLVKPIEKEHLFAILRKHLAPGGVETETNSDRLV